MYKEMEQQGGSGMNNIYHRPYLEQGKITYFPYSREKLLEKPIFPAYVFDGGAFFFLNDICL